MAIEDNPKDMWGYDVNEGFGTAAGHPKSFRSVAVNQRLDAVRRLVQARILDTALRDEILTALWRVYQVVG